MSQDQIIPLTQKIAFVAAVASAGFRLTNSTSLPTGSTAGAWRATLVHDNMEIVTVTNYGFGGPNASRYHAVDDTSLAAEKDSLNMLFAIPLVLAAVRKHLLAEVEMDSAYAGLSGSDYAVRCTQVLASRPNPTNELVEFVVGYLADTQRTVKAIARETTSNLLLAFDDDDATSEYDFWRLPDTPANRAYVLRNESRKLDYFVADLLRASFHGSAA